MKPMEVQTQFSDDIHAFGIHVKVWIPEANELAAQASGDPFTHSSNPVMSNPIVLNLVFNLAPALEALKNPPLKESGKEQFQIDEPAPIVKPLLPERPLSTERPTPMEKPVLNQRPALIETPQIKPKQNVISGKYAGLLV